MLNLDTLEPRIQKNQLVGRIRTRLLEMQKTVDLPEGQILSEEEVSQLNTMVEELVDQITGSERLLKSTQTTQGTKEPRPTKPAPVKAPTATGGVISGEVPQ